MNILAACAGLAFLLSSMAPAPTIGPVTGMAMPDPGFSTAAFPVEVLNDIMKDGECDSLRFYNIIDPSDPSAGTLMVIGVKKNGSELNGGLFGAPYKANTPKENDPAKINGLSKSDAAKACEAMAGSGKTSFSTCIFKDALSALIGVEGCTVVQLVSSSGGGVLQVSPAKIVDGKVVVIEGGAKQLTSDPCPVACGLRTNYVNEAVLPK